jgi:hypothetical protein
MDTRVTKGEAIETQALHGAAVEPSLPGNDKSHKDGVISPS